MRANNSPKKRNRNQNSISKRLKLSKPIRARRLQQSDSSASTGPKTGMAAGATPTMSDATESEVAAGLETNIAQNMRTMIPDGLLDAMISKL